MWTADWQEDSCVVLMDESPGGGRGSSGIGGQYHTCMKAETIHCFLYIGNKQAK